MDNVLTEEFSDGIQRTHTLLQNNISKLSILFTGCSGRANPVSPLITRPAKPNIGRLNRFLLKLVVNRQIVKLRSISIRFLGLL